MWFRFKGLWAFSSDIIEYLFWTGERVVHFQWLFWCSLRRPYLFASVLSEDDVMRCMSVIRNDGCLFMIVDESVCKGDRYREGMIPLFSIGMIRMC